MLRRKSIPLLCPLLLFIFWSEAFFSEPLKSSKNLILLICRTILCAKNEHRKVDFFLDKSGRKGYVGIAMAERG